ncbi:MAG: spore germination protein [Bacillota bacterium]
MPFLRIWQRLRSLVTRPERDLEAMQFSLGNRPEGGVDGWNREGGDREGGTGDSGDGDRGGPKGGGPNGAGGARRGGSDKQAKAQPSRVGRTGETLLPSRAGMGKTGERVGGTWPGERQGPRMRPDPAMGRPIPRDIRETLESLAGVFHVPENKDVVFRKFTIQSTPRARAFVAYIEGIADSNRVEQEVIFPLMELSLKSRMARGRLPALILNTLLPAGGVERKFYFEEVVGGILKGEVALFVETGCAFLVDVKARLARQPSEPISERTLRGPQLGFAENLRVNTAMIRSFLHDPDLVAEHFIIGERSRTLVGVMYIKDVANPELVAEVRRRLGSLRVDGLIDSSVLEHLIRDHVSLMPTVLATERVDRTCFQLLQGAAAIVVDGATQVLVLPVTFSTFLHSMEDVYLHPVIATFLRVLRLIGLVLATLLPGLYIAVVNYHAEMLPTSLLLAFAAAAEAVAFPAVVSVLFLDLSFELIREAGIRIPSPIGPTIGIVGALLIGDAAVRAALVSPITVIIIAMTALAGFIIPEQTISFTARIMRFVFLALGLVFGLYGIALGMFLIGVHLASVRSFGVPYLSPIGPWRPGSLDVILRGPFWVQEKRPIFLRPLDLIRQARYARGWDPGVPGGETEGRDARPPESDPGRSGR